MNLRLAQLRSLLTVFGNHSRRREWPVHHHGPAIGGRGEEGRMDHLPSSEASNILVRSAAPPEAMKPPPHFRAWLRAELRAISTLALRSLPPPCSHCLPVFPSALHDLPSFLPPSLALLPSANAVGTTPALFDLINLRCRARWRSSHHASTLEPCRVRSAWSARTAARQLSPYGRPRSARPSVGSTGGALSC